MKSTPLDRPTHFEEQDGFDLGEEFAESDETNHPDERWLVSYADMMTLLFGFFVLLYAMADKFDLIQKSASKQFNPPSVTATKGGATDDAAGEKGDVKLQVLQDERRLLIIKVADLEMQLRRAEANLSEKNKPTESIDELEEIIREQKGKLDQSKEVARENVNLRAQLVLKDLPPIQNQNANSIIVVNAVARLSGGGSFSTRVLKISMSGLQVQEIPPESLGQTFKITLQRENGSSVEVMAYLVTTPEGQRTHRLAITDFPNGDEQVLRSWFAPR